MSSRPADERAFRDQRRRMLRRATDLYGLDWVRVAGSSDEGRLWRLEVGFVGAVPSEPGTATFRLRGPDGGVDPAFTLSAAGPAAVQSRRIELDVRCHDAELAGRLGSETGVFELELVGLPADRFFARAPFRFDGGSIGEPPAAELVRRRPAAAEIDYLAKDYESFKKLMLDRIAVEAPQWRERNPADLGMTLVELLAYAADYLSHRQDAVATEAYLDTARRRVSVRRHLRLVGYHLHEAGNARVWVQFEGDPGVEPGSLPAGTRLLTHAGQLPTAETHFDRSTAFEIAGHQPTVILYPSADYDAAIDQGSLVFETLHELRVDPDLNTLRLHPWGADRYTVPEGATTAALAGEHPALRAGDVLIFEEVLDPATGWPPGDPGHRHAVRLTEPPRPGVDPATGDPITEIRFHDEDALPFPLTVAAVVGRERLRDVSVARGNVVLADHGETVQQPLQVPAEGARAWQPRLAKPGLVWSEPWDDSGERAAGATLLQDRDRALPAVRLVERGTNGAARGAHWLPRRDLLESSAFAQEFVVETDHDGSARLRFGDGRLGRRPLPGTQFAVAYRLGGGPSGQIGADSLAHLVEVVPDRATRLGWLEQAAAESGEEISDELVGALADRSTGSLRELEALWERVRGFAARLGRPPQPEEAGEAMRYVADLQQRLELLAHEARARGIELPLDLAEQLARHLRCDIEGPARVLGRALRFARATGREPSAVTVKQALDQHLGILRVRNPLPAVGGAAAEPVERARLLGPRAFRRRRSAVTVEDWRQRARHHPEVLDAVARHRCTGSWVTVVLHVHRRGGRPVDSAFRRRLREELEPALLADRDLEIRPPRPLPLEIRLRAEPERGWVAEAVRQRILERLDGFFHPDNFRFGQTLYLADLLDEAMALPGVLLVQPRLFRPLGDGGGDPVRSRIEPGELEIVTLRRRRGAAGGGVQVDIVEAA